MTSGVPIAAAIEALRTELQEAMDASADSSLKFEATSVEVELQASVTVSTNATGGVKWWLIEAGAGGSYERATTQTIRLTLTPTAVSKDGTVQTPFLDGQD